MRTRSDRLMWLPVALAAFLAVNSTAAVADEKEDKKEDKKEDTGPDTVHVFKDKERTQTIARKGEIMDETPGGLKLKTADGEKQIKREDIKDVAYGSMPPSMTKAELAIGRGDFEGAAALYKEVGESATTRGIFKPRAFLGQGRALVSAGKFADAGVAYQSVLKASPKGIYIRDAYSEGVRALIRAKDAKGAQTLAEAAKGAFKAAELPEEAQDEASLLLAEAQEAGGNLAGARSQYNLLTNSRNVRVKGRALLGAARAAFAQNEIERAEGQYKQILAEKEVERSIRCGAARGLGDAIMKRPGASKDLAKLRAAAVAYSTAAAVQFPARGEPTEDREASLHEGAKVYDLLGELSAGDKDAKARDLYANMAREMRQELVRLYKTSQYKDENEKKLAKAPETGSDKPQ